MLRVGVGDRLPVRDTHGRVLDVRVTGIFRAPGPGRPGLAHRPAAAPRARAAGSPPACSRPASLPDGRLALDPQDVRVAATFYPGPIRWRDTGTVATAAVALKASSAAEDGVLQRWTTDLDTVLTGVRARVTAAGAQAAVLLAGLVTTAVLVLLLAADLLVRRRAGVLAGARGRGATLPGLGAELALESVAVAVVAAAAGLGAAPAAGRRPGLAMVAAGGGRGRGGRAGAGGPVGRDRRRGPGRAGQPRGPALGPPDPGAAPGRAGGGGGAGRGRGVRGAAAARGDGGRERAAGAGADPGRRDRARWCCCGCCPGPPARRCGWPPRSRRGLPLLGAAQVAATSGRPLPVLVLVPSTALLTYAVVLEATERPGAAGALADGLRELAVVSAVVLLAFALLGVVLGAAATAPARGRTLARLRTLGLRPREARQVAVGELLPLALAGAAGGVAIGLALAYASIGLLDLRRLTGAAADPPLVLPPVTVVPVALVVVAVAAVVAAESGPAPPGAPRPGPAGRDGLTGPARARRQDPG